MPISRTTACTIITLIFAILLASAIPRTEMHVKLSFYKDLVLVLMNLQPDYHLENLHELHASSQIAAPSSPGPIFDRVREIDTSLPHWRDEFQRLWDYPADEQTPIVLRKFARDSNAPLFSNFSDWNVDYLSRHVFKDDNPVPIFVNMSNDKSAVRQKFSSFLKDLRDKKKVYMRCVPDESGVIDDQIPYDFITSLTKKSFAAKVTRFLGARTLGCFFVGNNEVSTRMHCDVMSTHFIQIQGRKEWFFFPPTATRLLFPMGQRWNAAYNTHVDIFNVNHTKYPLYKSLRGETTVLHPGDMLVFPSMWWHGVRNLDDVTIGFDVATADLFGSWKRNPVLTLGTMMNPSMMWSTVKQAVMGGRGIRASIFNQYFIDKKDYY